MAAAIRMSRGVLEMLRNRDSAALAEFQASELVARWPGTSPHHLIPWIRGFLLLALVRLGQTGQAGQFLDGLSDADREHGEIRIGEAALRLATGDPRAATAAIAPALDGSAPVAWQNELAQAYVLEAVARDALGDAGAADDALERAGPGRARRFAVAFPAASREGPARAPGPAPHCPRRPGRRDS
jgi:LuxR family maltose regulon positive regulatory protein